MGIEIVVPYKKNGVRTSYVVSKEQAEVNALLKKIRDAVDYAKLNSQYQNMPEQYSFGSVFTIFGIVNKLLTEITKISTEQRFHTLKYEVSSVVDTDPSDYSDEFVLDEISHMLRFVERGEIPPEKWAPPF